MASKNSDDKEIRCSFCGKTHAQVEKLIAGEGVFICNECILLCQEIIADDLVPGAGKKKLGQDSYSCNVGNLRKITQIFPEELFAAELAPAMGESHISSYEVNTKLTDGSEWYKPLTMRQRIAPSFDGVLQLPEHPCGHDVVARFRARGLSVSWVQRTVIRLCLVFPSRAPVAQRAVQPAPRARSPNVARLERNAG